MILAQLLEYFQYTKKITLTMLGIVFIFVLTIILASYSPNDPSWSHIGSDLYQVTNMGGSRGAWFADLLLTFFGHASWFLLVCAMYETSLQWWYRKRITFGLFRVIGYIVLLLSLTMLLAMKQTTDKLNADHSIPEAIIEPMITSGGVIGYEASSRLITTFTPLWSWTLLICLVPILVTLVFDIRWIAVFTHLISLKWLGSGLEEEKTKYQPELNTENSPIRSDISYDDNLYSPPRPLSFSDKIKGLFGVKNTTQPVDNTTEYNTEKDQLIRELITQRKQNMQQQEQEQLPLQFENEIVEYVGDNNHARETENIHAEAFTVDDLDQSVNGEYPDAYVNETNYIEEYADISPESPINPVETSHPEMMQADIQDIDNNVDEVKVEIEALETDDLTEEDPYDLSPADYFENSHFKNRQFEDDSNLSPKLDESESIKTDATKKGSFFKNLFGKKTDNTDNPKTQKHLIKDTNVSNTPNVETPESQAMYFDEIIQDNNQYTTIADSPDSYHSAVVSDYYPEHIDSISEVQTDEQEDSFDETQRDTLNITDATDIPDTNIDSILDIPDSQLNQQTSDDQTALETSTAALTAKWLGSHATVSDSDISIDNRTQEKPKTQQTKTEPKSKSVPNELPKIHDDNAFIGKSRAFQTAKHRKKLSPVPSLDILDKPNPNRKPSYTPEELKQLSKLLEIKLQDFNVKSEVRNAIPGPVVTRFEVELAPGVKASKVVNISRDLARSLSMASLRVVEVIPGKPYIGIEVPNKAREMVRLIELLNTPKYQDPKGMISMAMGKDISGKPIITDLAKAPHMLVAGTTGSGKSVLVNSMLLSILLKYTPEQLRLILIDPKQLELANYNDIPHLLTPVVTDMTEAASALSWCVAEMERRYQLMSLLKVRKLNEFNKKVIEAEKNGTPIIDPLWRPNDSVSIDKAPKLKTLPMIVIVADEFADMIMQVGKQAEELITRLAQKSRAAGIHLMLATQRPSVDVITGLIKANIPVRAALRVNSKVDSRTILDNGGAEDMLGNGDMLFLGPGQIEPNRVHGAFVSDEEVNRVCEAWRERGAPEYIDNFSESFKLESTNTASSSGGTSGEDDKFYNEAVAFVLETRKISASSIQRKFSIGYNRAARIVDAMESAGIVSPMVKGKREILV